MTSMKAEFDSLWDAGVEMNKDNFDLTQERINGKTESGLSFM